MILVQVVPKADVDISKLLRDQVTHHAQTFYWANKIKTRLKHSGHDGYIEIGTAEGIVVALIKPAGVDQPWGLTEKFIGRLTSWFGDRLVAINMQFVGAGMPALRKKGK